MAGVTKRASNLVGSILLATALSLLGGAVVAHHSSAGFEAERTIQLSGTVQDFQWANPHIWIELDVAGPDGIVERWSIEGGVPNRLFRAGWRPNSFEPGDEVTIVTRPMKDGGKAGIFVGARFADGSTLGRFPEAN